MNIVTEDIDILVIKFRIRLKILQYFEKQKHQVESSSNVIKLILNTLNEAVLRNM